MWFGMAAKSNVFIKEFDVNKINFKIGGVTLVPRTGLPEAARICQRLAEVTNIQD